ncbi:MAG: pectate lyase [Clostridia bacterium]|nr:pectate lyase [Clostridia bacterium]
MSKNLKRVFAALVASLGVFAFAGCNTGGNNGGSGEGSGNEQTEQTGGQQKPNGSQTEGGNGVGGGQQKPSDPVIPTVPEGSVKITKAAGDLEAAYVVWEKVPGAMGYNVYCKADGGDYVKLDDQLVREYKDYCRADAVGLKAGTYSMKVVPTGGEQLTEDNDKAAAAEKITVLAHDRSGYAFVKGTASGAYNEDGTLKSDAVVLYVTNDNYKTVSVTYGANTVTGIDNILGQGYQKKNGATKPLCVRIIGSLGNGSKVDFKANGDLELKSLDQGVTIEGIGSDATANGWGMHITSCTNIEIRNLAFMNMMGGTKDGVGYEKDCDHLWTHNCDFFYGHNWGGDQKKGDGALDTKSCTYVTHSYNHFWDSGKCNLQGMKEETTSNYITYHHNWYDHSDSRHPRIRTCTTHIYNNYFDGNAKYGVGVTKGASAFVENNYFRSTAAMRPMMSSMQGTDALGDGTFSSEDGGIIKSYNNTYDCTKSNLKLITQNDTADKSGIDCYEASSREETVSSEYTAKKGGTTYNNFDTAADFYEYEVDSPEDAKVKVQTYAGRIDGGDLKFEFNNAKEDANYDIIPELSALLQSYKGSVVKIGGKEVSGGSTSGGPAEGGDTEGGDEEGGTTGGSAIEGAITFIPSASGNGFTVEGTTKDLAEIVIEGTTVPKGSALKLNSNGKVTFSTTETMTLHLYVASNTTVKVDGSAKTPVAKDGYYQITVTINAGSHTIEKGGGEAHLYLIKLVPAA